ncbi:hypothetical protein BBK14_07880 [Parafrankia soli]|uniref:Uncharacterized protein n=1 Tax=Parafrankia soli TaxID=2599596 RepID=A0A1S1PHJ9_9ACTN|nr:hypothetical protein [Parafrankia soli]OHV21190.1 hypothetical protein BBK14_07880 [Parafrankia soli]
MFYVPTTTPLRERFAHTARRLALVAAVRVLDRLEAVAGETTTPTGAPALPAAAPAASCCGHGPADHDALGCTAAVGFPGMSAARCDCLTPAPAVEVIPAGPALLAAADMPPVETIEAAAAEYDEAAEQARTAERGKRRARKLLDHIPAGTYGRALVERVESARTTPDLDAIRAAYARAGLGEVPMKPIAPTLRVTMAPAVEVDGVEGLAVAA